MNSQLKDKNYSLNIGWLYPDLMSTYGDRGNILVLQKRCEWRGIAVSIIPITPETSSKEMQTVSLLFGGGAQDREQEIVIQDMMKKRDSIHNLVDQFIPSLFVCGSPQLMGKFYEPSQGKRIEGLGIFDMETVHPGPDAPRLIGNTIAKVNWENLNFIPSVIANEVKQSKANWIATSSSTPRNDDFKYFVGFENHGGRTTLGPNAKPFATVIKGFGNNGEDGTEGVVYKNAIGCYFHGPLLPKNPHIADFLIAKALEIKYQKEIQLSSLDDSLEIQAHNSIVKRLGVEI